MSTIKSIQLQAEEVSALRKLCDVLQAQRDESRRYADELLDDGRKTDANLQSIYEHVERYATQRGLQYRSAHQALDLIVLALRQSEEALAEERREHEATRVEFAKTREQPEARWAQMQREIMGISRTTIRQQEVAQPQAGAAMANMARSKP